MKFLFATLLLLSTAAFADCTDFSGTYLVDKGVYYIWDQKGCDLLVVTEVHGTTSSQSVFITDGEYRRYSQEDDYLKAFLFKDGNFVYRYLADENIITTFHKEDNGDITADIETEKHGSRRERYSFVGK